MTPKVSDESIDIELSTDSEGEDDDSKQHEVKATSTRKRSVPEPVYMSVKMKKSVANVKWSKHGPTIYKFLTENKRTIVPRIYKRYNGDKNFQLYDKRLYLFGREVVYDKKRKDHIVNMEEEYFGGETKGFSRVQAKYIGIPRSAIERLYRGSERRQLKAHYQKQVSDLTYIHSGRPGSIQIDLTFYRNQKLPIFGAIDVFSRYCFYERVRDKRASTVAIVLQKAVEHFENISNFNVTKVSSDSGVEFQKETTAYLRRRNIYYDRQVRSRKLIESLNRSLRLYVERVSWDTIRDLDILVEKFVSSYNSSKHGSTKRVPNDLIRIQEEDIREEDKRQRKNKNVSKSEGFRMAKLVIGDRVRIYDPKRKEIKHKQKQEQRGKIKLSEKDYVKKFTSHHAGNAPHWTKEVFKIERVITGKITNRYLVVGKKGSYFRHELKKVPLILKKDPRIAEKDRKSAARQNYEARLPPVVRKAKYMHKVYQIHYSDEPDFRQSDIAVILDVYKNYFIIFHWLESGELSFCDLNELHANANRGKKLRDVKTVIKNNLDRIQKAKQEIDETYQEFIRDTGYDPNDN